MKFIGSRLSQIFGWSINYGNLFSVIPMSWNPVEFRKIQELKTLRNITYAMMQFFFCSHHIFLVIRLYQSISSKHHDSGLYVLQFCYVYLFTIVIIVQFSFVVNKTEWIRFLNLEITFYMEAGGKFHLDLILYWCCLALS